MKELDRQRVDDLQKRMLEAASVDWETHRDPLELMMAALDLAALFVPAYSLHDREGITEEAFVKNARRLYRHHRETWGRGKGTPS